MVIVEGVVVAPEEPALAGGALEKVRGGTSARVLVITILPRAALERTTHVALAVLPIVVVLAVAKVSLLQRGLSVAGAAILTGLRIARIVGAATTANRGETATFTTETSVKGGGEKWGK